MYARPLFVVVGILGPFCPVFPQSVTFPCLGITGGCGYTLALMNDAIKPGPENPPQVTGLPQLSVVVPTFNERDNVTVLYRRLEATLRDISWEVVFVDDNSPDGTWEVVRGLARQDQPRTLHPPHRAARPLGRLHRGHSRLQRAVCRGDRRRFAA